jgi:6-pyruvoyltetrahydropterin/6-carboxytetrahydropterin synthase
MEFSAAHALRDYEGPCARTHGHNYRIEVVVQGRDLDDRRLLIDFYDLKQMLRPLVDRLDHRDLNEVAPFTEINPTAEAIAAWFFEELKKEFERLGDSRIRLAEVHVWETPNSCASYSEE